MNMRVSVFTEPHRGASYDDQLRFARMVEAGGFEGFLRADHYQSMGADPGLPGPTDAWLTLAALARETERIRLGTLVTSATFRLPGPLAVMVAQVDQMSGGRVDLGIGAGWYEREHISYGIPFPKVGERFDRLAEQLEVITGLWRTPPGATYSYAGDHYRLVDAPALPKPVQVPGPPIIVGGRGPKRTPELAARYADEFNMPFKSVAETAKAYDRVREACDRSGRTESGRAPLGALRRNRGGHRANRRRGAATGRATAREERAASGGPGGRLARAARAADRRVRRDRRNPGAPAPDRFR